jgi:hypothetical protein
VSNLALPFSVQAGHNFVSDCCYSSTPTYTCSTRCFRCICSLSPSPPLVSKPLLSYPLAPLRVVASAAAPLLTPTLCQCCGAIGCCSPPHLYSRNFVASQMHNTLLEVHMLSSRTLATPTIPLHRTLWKFQVGDRALLPGGGTG